MPREEGRRGHGWFWNWLVHYLDKQNCHIAVMYNLIIFFPVCYNNTFILCKRRKFGSCSFHVFKKLCNFTVLKIWQGFVILFKMNIGCQILELFNNVVLFSNCKHWTTTYFNNKFLKIKFCIVMVRWWLWFFFVLRFYVNMFMTCLWGLMCHKAQRG